MFSILTVLEGKELFSAFKFFPSKTVNMIFISKGVKLSPVQNFSFPESSKQKGTEQSYLPIISFLMKNMVCVWCVCV